jgi:hypothetical protein
MNATLVGADRLGNIPAVLRSRGIAVLQHISGRPAIDQRRVPSLPRGTQLLILFTDFINHNVMQSFRRAAQEQGIPVLACRRSSSCLLQTLERTGLSGLNGCPCAALNSSAGARQ